MVKVGRVEFKNVRMGDGSSAMRVISSQASSNSLYIVVSGTLGEKDGGRTVTCLLYSRLTFTSDFLGNNYPIKVNVPNGGREMNYAISR